MFAVALCALLPHAASAAVSAARCSGCSTELAWQQKAIGQGAGPRYVYDFGSRQLRKYQVASEYEPELHRYVSFATPLNVEPAYADYFLDAASASEQIGGLSKTIVVDLAQTTGGHSNDSIFDMFHESGGPDTFGGWLGDYLAGVPLNPDVAQLQALALANPGIHFTSNPIRLIVVVNFRNGYAKFELFDDERRYLYVDGSARDQNNNKIPARPRAIGSDPYTFPGGRTSSNYREFMELINRWNLTHRWSCGTAQGGGMESVTCVLLN
ncbi:MAG: hypothetical protein ACTHK2_07955 [Dokdonella sp.]